MNSTSGRTVQKSEEVLLHIGNNTSFQRFRKAKSHGQSMVELLQRQLTNGRPVPRGWPEHEPQVRAEFRANCL